MTKMESAPERSSMRMKQVADEVTDKHAGLFQRLANHDSNDVYNDVDNSDRCKQAAERLRELAKLDCRKMVPLHTRLKALNDIADLLDPASAAKPVTQAELLEYLRCTTRSFSDGVQLADRIERDGIAECITPESTKTVESMQSGCVDASKKQPKNDASEARIESGHESRSVPDIELDLAAEAYVAKTLNDSETAACFEELDSAFKEGWRQAKQTQQPGSEDLAVPVDELLESLKEFEVAFDAECERAFEWREAMDLQDRIQAARRAGHPTGVK